MADKQLEVHVPLQDRANGAAYARFFMRRYLIHEEGIDPMTDIRFGSVMNVPDGLVTYDLVRRIEPHSVFRAECGGPEYEFERLDDGVDGVWSRCQNGLCDLGGSLPGLTYKFVVHRKNLTSEE